MKVGPAVPAPRKAKIQHGEPRRATEKREGFRVREWGPAAFPDPGLLCLTLGGWG